MDKYIKLDTAKKTLLDYIYEFDASRANPDFVRGITYAREGLDRVPLEDVAPVVHGWWEGRFCHPMRDGEWQYICSVCKNDNYWRNNVCYQKHRYCPNCGAKMDRGLKTQTKKCNRCGDY